MTFDKPIQSQTRGAAPAAAPNLPEFGALIAQCGPQKSGMTHYLVMGGVALVFALLCVIAPITFLVPKPADAVAVNGFCWAAGGLGVLFALGLSWQPLFGQNQTILLYERGLVERVGQISYAVSLEDIEFLCVQEWYNHRFAPRTFNVRAMIRGDKELSFSSALRGDADHIIGYLTAHVEQTEMVPFQP